MLSETEDGKGVPGAVKGGQGFGSCKEMETEHSPWQEGDKSQDYCLSPGDRLSFPVSERKLKKLRLTTMRERGGQEGVDTASIQNLDEQSRGSVAASMLVQYYQQVP